MLVEGWLSLDLPLVLCVLLVTPLPGIRHPALASEGTPHVHTYTHNLKRERILRDYEKFLGHHLQRG